MRTVFLLPLTALVAVAAGCGSEAREQRRSVPERDLTLVTQTAYVEIASPVETQVRRAPARRSSREPKVQLAVFTAPLAALGAGSAPVLAAPEPVAKPASTASTPEEGASSDNGRELLPGKTVTLIPASSGPSTGSDEADELPAARGRPMVVRGGGKCGGRGRGPGIGIAGAPRPDFR